MADIEDLDKTIGFERPCKKPVEYSVELYKAHLFVCTGVPPEQWPKSIDTISEFFGALVKTIKDSKFTLGKIPVTGTDLKSTAENQTDLLFYDGTNTGMRITGLHKDNTQLIVDFLQNPQKPIDGLTVTPVTEKWSIFICSHTVKDPRCGYCGPRMMDSLREYLKEKDLLSQTICGKISHVGRHDLAANVIIFPKGVWYGYCTPKDTPRIVDEFLQKGTILKDKLRGVLGYDKAQTEALCNSAE